MINDAGSIRYSNYFAKRAKMPPPSIMLTKGQCKLSEKELIAKVKELARRDAAEGRNSFLEVPISPAWRKLKDDYISFASPDRAGSIRKKLSYLTGNTASMHLKGFDLFHMLNRRKIHDPDVSPDTIIFRDELGREIASCSRRAGWTFPGTTAEYARSYAFDDLWKQALADARGVVDEGSTSSTLSTMGIAPYHLRVMKLRHARRK